MLRILASLMLALSIAALGCGGDDTPPAGTDGGGVRADGGGGGGFDGGGVGFDGGGGGGGTDGGIATDGGVATDGGGGMTGTGAVGEACMMDGDCDGMLVCRTMQSLTVSTLTFPGGYCTQDCGSTGGGGGGAMCPSGSECAGTFMGFGMGFCARTCTTVADCRTGYECRALFSFGGGGGGGPTYCLPPGGGIGFDGSFPSFDGGLPGFP